MFTFFNPTPGFGAIYNSFPLLFHVMLEGQLRRFTASQPASLVVVEVVFYSCLVEAVVDPSDQELQLHFRSQ